VGIEGGAGGGKGGVEVGGAGAEGEDMGGVGEGAAEGG